MNRIRLVLALAIFLLSFNSHTALSQQPVGRFVQADDLAVHEMADDEHKRNRQPEPAVLQRDSHPDLRENERR